MSLAPWRSHLTHALHRNRSLIYSRYVQLATVRENNRPANRTVVFRGFLENTNRLKFITDARSPKVEQIDYQPWGEICWYFANTREQFRISGKLILVKDNEANLDLQKARKITWQELSDTARSQFTWPETGKLRAEAAAFQAPQPNPNEPLDSFYLLLLEPDFVDHLELRGEPQNRSLYKLDSEGNWFMEEVNP
ncbi:pyridoxamine 5'-phosphate oxidase [[Phormidium ambiguum] IAM M-71]|uniref:Pyridoxamine 5'-phosphate oxidase n=1 Tax=[Phormidium ambiguum] IAM M-71 TaxID=454136 RepID=A0A1U7I650_9CYAN|nr:Npun_F5749 family FMN-dependent PPOX-type flavoprotein [Phormidium ambiguum]OKH31786.1 pyridoxamine 5'-phosphate oxidase [Phormidium ambiguum IAM M-71]